jgi:uncharacterized membrane protein (DUF2068 family)
MHDERPAPPGLTGLHIIAGFKFLQAATLIAAGLGALGLMNPGVSEAAQEWLALLALRNGERLAGMAAARMLPYLDAATPRQFGAIGVGAFLYASVFLVEGTGLWRGKRWAEYLTIAVTASLLPFEIAAIVNRVTLVRVGTLAINLFVIGYLVWELRARQRQHATRLAEPPRTEGPRSEAPRAIPADDSVREAGQ